MSKHKSEDYKISAVKYYLESNDNQENVCKIFKCSVRSLLRWVERYKNEDEIKRHNRKPIAYKVSKEHVKFILDVIKKDKTITTEDLLIKFKDKFKDIELTRRHISNIIRDNNNSLKILSLIEINNYLELIKQNMYYIFYLKKGEHIYGMYFFKNAKMQYEDIDGNTLQFFGSFNNSDSVSLFYLGFLHSIQKIIKKNLGENLII